VSGGEALDVVVRGPDGAVWVKQFTQSATGSWRSLGGRTLAGSGPAAVNVGGTLYVLALDTAGTVFVNRSTDGAHWSGWRSLGGTASGDVGVATPARGVGVVFVRGPGNAAFYREFAGTTPGVTAGWHSLGGSLTSGVGAGSKSNGTTYALVLGPGNAVYFNEFAGTTAGVSHGWHSLGGSLTSGVGAGSVPHGKTAVVVLGPNGHIFARAGIWPAFGNWTMLF